MLTPNEKEELKKILDNNMSRGAFLGMIFNASISQPALTNKELIKMALRVRLDAEELVR